VGRPDSGKAEVPTPAQLTLGMASYFKRKMSDKDYYLSMAKRPNSTKHFSKYRGVTKANKPNKYRSVLTYKGQRFYLGEFYSEIEAAKAYNEAALKIIGEYAVINDFSDLDNDPENTSNDHGTTRLPSETNGGLHEEAH
jgi:hypothetical protein